MNAEHICALRALWKLSFGDTDTFLDNFFTTAFSPERHHFLSENGIPVSALYWFDCCLEGKPFAYIYAVATHPGHRGKGLAGKLLEKTHEILKQQGYAGAILVPGSESLFDFYKKLGYRKAATVTEFTCTADHTPTPLTQIDAKAYVKLRQAYLPRGGVVQEGAALDFFACYGNFYRGEDFLLAGTAQDGVLYVREFLGNTDRCGSALGALGFSKGVFRTPGTEKDFAMYFQLREDCPAPQYIGFALD